MPQGKVQRSFAVLLVIVGGYYLMRGGAKK
jgi:hypothetical protein